MRSLFLIFIALSLLSCQEAVTTIVSLDKITTDNIKSINIESTKESTGDTYYNLEMIIKGKQLSYDLDDQRDAIVGQSAIALGFKDSKGSIALTQDKLIGLLGMLVNVEKRSAIQGLLTTTISITSDAGICTIKTQDNNSTAQLENYIQDQLLENKLKLRI
jgi:hypothetical protein